jgi:hypothetical protein
VALACRPTDERLLLLIHKQLTVGARLFAVAHLAVCPECRKRKEELQKATYGLASAVRGPLMPAWRPHATVWASRQLLAAALAILAVVALIGSFRSTMKQYEMDGSSAPAPIIVHMETGCEEPEAKAGTPAKKPPSAKLGIPGKRG